MSIKDYLVSERIKCGAASTFSINAALAHSMITTTCLGYLLHLGGLSSIDATALQPFPLALYAAKYWILHMRLGSGDEYPVWQLMIRLFAPEGNALENWVRLEDPEAVFPADHRDETEPPPPIHPRMYYAASFGLEELVTELLKAGDDAQERGGRCGTALGAASYHGHIKTVQILLDHGGGAEYASAMQAACWCDHIAVVRLLLAHGADVNAPGGFFGTALQSAASSPGGEALVRLLLDRGADVNAPRGPYGTALQSAAFNGSEAVVRLLLGRGADVNARPGTFGTALQAASLVGCAEVVRLLLDNGADIASQGAEALRVARAKGYDDIVQMLLDRGVVEDDNKEPDDRENVDAEEEAKHRSGPEYVEQNSERGTKDDNAAETGAGTLKGDEDDSHWYTAVECQDGPGSPMTGTD